jgi:fatty-acyl-CoA synthase
MSDPLHASPTVGEQMLRALARYPSRAAFPARRLHDLPGRDRPDRKDTGRVARLGFVPGTRVALLTASRADTWCAGAAAGLSRLTTTSLHPLGSLDDQLFQLRTLRPRC